MIQYIIDAADEVGIAAYVSNSTEKIETQLNRITKESDLPIMLVSWDLDVTLAFDSNGFLENPSVDAVVLLVEKPEDLSKVEAEESAVNMGKLYQQFLQVLHGKLNVYQKQEGSPIPSATYKLVPRHGAGKHSGILGKFTMKTDVANC